MMSRLGHLIYGLVTAFVFIPLAKKIIGPTRIENTGIESHIQVSANQAMVGFPVSERLPD